MSDEIIRGRVEADVSGYKRGMDEAARATDGFRRQAESAARGGVTTLQAVMGSLGRSLPLVSGGVAGVALAAVGLARSAASTAAEMGRMADAVGVSAEEMSRYAYAARIMNIDTGALQGGMAALKRAVESNSPVFKAMGVATHDAAGKARDMVAVTLDLADKFHGYSAGAGEATLAQAAFGNDFKKLLPLFDGGAEKLRGLIEEADEFGAVVTDEAAAAAEAFEEDMRRLQGMIPGLVQELGGPLVSALGDVAREFLAARRAGMSFMEMTGGALFNDLYSTGTSVEQKLAERRKALEKLKGGNWFEQSWGERLNPAFNEAQIKKEIASLEDLQRQQLAAAGAAEVRGTASVEAGRKAAEAAAGELKRLKEEEDEREKNARNGERAAARAAAAAARAAAATARSTAEYERNAEALDELIERVDAKALAEAEGAVRAYHAAWADLLNGLDAQARSLEEQVELYGLTEAQIAAVTLRRSEERLEMARANGGATADYLEKLEREVELRRQIAGAAGTLEARQANTAAAEAATREWERTAQEIEGAIYDAIVSGGEDAGEVLERTFKALVLRPIIQPIAQAAAGVVTGALGFGQPGASGGGSSGGGLSPTSMIPGSVMGNAALWAGSALGAGTMAGGFLTGMGTAAVSGAGTLGTMSAGASLMGTAGGGAAGAGMMVGAALPWVGAAIALASLLGAFDKKPSDKTSSVAVDTSDLSVDYVWDMGGKKAASQEQKDANTALSLLVGSFAQQAGLDGQILTAMGGRDGTRLAIDGGFRTPMGETARGVWLGDETAYNYGNGPEAIVAMLNDLVDEGTLPQETIDRWKALKANADGTARDAVELVDTLALINQGLSDTEILRADLIQAEGETLGQAATRIRDMMAAFEPITADEAWTKATRALADEFGKLGQAMPQTASEFARVVNALDLTTDAGQDAYRAMTSLAPAFLQLSAVVDEVFASISKTTAESVRDIEMAVLDNAGKYAYLDTEINSLLEKLGQSVDTATIQGLFEQINAKTTQAFNLLDEGEQKRLSGEFVDRLYEAEALAQQRLSVAPLDYQPQIEVAQAQQQAAQKQSEAADAQKEAASAIRDAALRMAAAAGRIEAGTASAGSTSGLSDLADALRALRPAEVGY